MLQILGLFCGNIGIISGCMWLGWLICGAPLKLNRALLQKCRAFFADLRALLRKCRAHFADLRALLPTCARTYDRVSFAS